MTLAVINESCAQEVLRQTVIAKTWNEVQVARPKRFELLTPRFVV